MGPVENLEKTRKELNQWYEEMEPHMEYLQTISDTLRQEHSLTRFLEKVEDSPKLSDAVACCISAAYMEVAYWAKKKEMTELN